MTTTQEQNPGRAVLRTLLAAAVGLFPLVNGILLALQQALEPYRAVLPEWTFLVVNGVALAAIILTAVVTRILAVPGVNDWLRKYRILELFAPDSPGRHEA